MSRKLSVFFGREPVGILSEDDNERYSFEYGAHWQEREGAFPLSLALRLNQGPFGHLETKSFFENLLPESGVLKELSPGADDNSFNFLSRYGWDCAGAFSIVEGEKPPSHSWPPKYKEISLEKIHGYLEKNQKLASSVMREDGGRFFLAGVQDKFAAIYRRKKILIPLEGEPTSHIIKPPAPSLLDSPYNEYFCMKLAGRVGLNVPEVDVISGEFPLYLVKRFDRKRGDDGIERIHQQDFCQALGLTSQKKYQSDGGPGLREHFKLIEEHSTSPGKDIIQFFRWLWFNILIGNNDCHAKNLAFVTTPSGPALAPFYDLLGISIYSGYDGKFTYSIGGNWHWNSYKFQNFELLAQECGFSVEAIFRIGAELFKKMDIQLEREARSFRNKFGRVDAVERVESEVGKRMGHLRGRMKELPARQG